MYFLVAKVCISYLRKTPVKPNKVLGYNLIPLSKFAVIFPSPLHFYSF